MLTPLYTPPIRNIATIPRRPKPQNGALEDATEAPFNEKLAEQQTEKLAPTSENPDGQRRQNQNGTLGSLQEQQTRGRISIHTIVADFQKTLESINASKSVKDDVVPYLQVIAHQARQKNPSEALIRQNLTIAAATIDQFIGQSLGQPSNVVKEWVEALLLQPIQFSSRSNSVAQPDVTPAIASTLTAEEREQIEADLLAGQLALKESQSDIAKTHFQSALQTLGNHENEPLSYAKALSGLSRIAQQSGDLPEAMTLLKQSLSHLDAIEPHRMQARLLMTLSGLQRETGDTQGSLSALERAEGLFHVMEQPENALKARHRQARLHLENKAPDKAQALMAESIEAGSANDFLLQIESWELLGRAQQAQGQYKEAFQSLRLALESAQNQGSPELFKRVAQTLAGLYLETGKPEKAVTLLQKAVS